MAPLFSAWADGGSRDIEKLFEEHDRELSFLLAPLQKLSAMEQAAVSAHDLAAATAAAWEANSAVLRTLLPRHPHVTRALAPPNRTDVRPTEDPRANSAGSYLSSSLVVAHLVRDWSEDGEAARACTHRPVLRAINNLHRARRRPLTVLVPGAGACRLAWEIARRGHRVEANDASAAMIVAAHTLMHQRPDGMAGRYQLYPRVRCSGGAVRRAACLQASAVGVPVARPVKRRWRGIDAQHSGSDWHGSLPWLTLQIGSWSKYSPPRPYSPPAVEVGMTVESHTGSSAGRATDAASASAGMRASADVRASADASFDVVVTSYFLDTQTNPAEAVARIRRLLAPSGVWINVGPLVWHDPAAGLLRLTLDELLGLLKLSGFKLRTLRQIPRVPYVGTSTRSRWAWAGALSHLLARDQGGTSESTRAWGGLLGAADEVHDCVFWVAALAAT